MPSDTAIRLSEAEPALLRFLLPDDRVPAGDILLPLASLGPGEDLHELIGGARAFAAVVLDGMLAQSLCVNGHAGLRLLGPGDVVSLVQVPRLSNVEVGECRASGDVRMALLEREILLAARRWPLFVAGLHAHGAQQTKRLLAQMMICQMPRVDERVMAIMWLLADVWGQATPVGTLLRLKLTHQLIGELVGARRPTVTLAVGELVDRGALLRQDGGWLLLERPDARSRVEPSRDVFDEPRVLDAVASKWARRIDPNASVDDHGTELRERIAQLREQHERNKAIMRVRLDGMGALRFSPDAVGVSAICPGGGAGEDHGPGRHRYPAADSPGVSVEGDVAGLHEPPGGQELPEGVQEAAGDRKPGAAEEGEDRHAAADRWADRVGSQEVAEEDSKGGERQQSDEDQGGHRQPAPGR